MRDGPTLSDTRPQSSGIAQGCPLSPYLFIIMLSIIMGDVESPMPDVFATCEDLTYADDMALYSEDVDSLQAVLEKIMAVAKQ